MTRNEALKLDLCQGAYSDKDPETGKFNVYGTRSGFVYATYDDVEEAADAGVELHDWLTRSG